MLGHQAVERVRQNDGGTSDSPDVRTYERRARSDCPIREKCALSAKFPRAAAATGERVTNSTSSGQSTATTTSTGLPGRTRSRYHHQVPVGTPGQIATAAGGPSLIRGSGRYWDS